jgi:hypothetical protein
MNNCDDALAKRRPLIERFAVFDSGLWSFDDRADSSIHPGGPEANPDPRPVAIRAGPMQVSVEGVIPHRRQVDNAFLDAAEQVLPNISVFDFLVARML